MFFCCIAFITSFALFRCFFYKSLIALYQAQVSVCNFICRLCLPSPDLSSALSAPQQTLPIPHHMQLPFLPMQLSFSPFSSFLGHVCGIIWGMSGASSGARLWHHLGHLGMSLACLGQSKISEVLHASLMPFFNLISLFSTLTISPPPSQFCSWCEVRRRPPTQRTWERRSDALLQTAPLSTLELHQLEEIWSSAAKALCFSKLYLMSCLLWECTKVLYDSKWEFLKVLLCFSVLKLSWK